MFKKCLFYFLEDLVKISVDFRFSLTLQFVEISLEELSRRKNYLANIRLEISKKQKNLENKKAKIKNIMNQIAQSKKHNKDSEGNLTLLQRRRGSYAKKLDDLRKKGELEKRQKNPIKYELSQYGRRPGVTPRLEDQIDQKRHFRVH